MGAQYRWPCHRLRHIAPGWRPPLAVNDPVLGPVDTATDDDALEKKTRRISAVMARMKEEIHPFVATSRPEGERRQEDDRPATFAEKAAGFVHVLNGREAGQGFAPDEPPHGAWLMNLCPLQALIRWPGVSVWSCLSCPIMLSR